MSTLKNVLRSLATDPRELALFIGNGDEWIQKNMEGSKSAEREEMKRVARDIDAYFERRLHQELDTGAESRFMRGQPIARRHLMFKAASLVLAAPLAALMAQDASAGAGEPLFGRGEEDDKNAGETACDNSGCSDSGSGCTYNGCSNDNCTQTMGCSDSDCQNNQRCNDTNCSDTVCGNIQQCDDTNCTELAFRGFHAAAVAHVKRFPMSRAFRREPLARGPEAKTVEVMVSARSHASFCANGRAHDSGWTRYAHTSVQVIKAMQSVA